MISIFSILVLVANPINAQLEKTNWLTGETDFITFQYPPGWELKVTTSRFDVQDFQLLEPITNTLIQGSKGEIETEYYQENPENYYDLFIIGSKNSIIGEHKVQSYPYGEITIGELPAYAELYSGKFDYLSKDKFGVLISMIFYDDNSKYYSIISGGPVSEYDKMEPIMLEIMKSITLKD
jgi:hypothetical protein